MGIWRRVKNLFQHEQVSDEIEEELQAHLEMAAEEGEHSGLSPVEARRTARLRFGNPVAMRERTAGADMALALDGLWRDVRHALRQLKRSPAFTVTAIVTLALGIGATTAIFTLIQQVMLRSLPVRQPEQLWRIGDSDVCCYSVRYAQEGGDWNLFSWEAYRFFREHTSSFENLAAFQIGMGNAELAVRRAGSSSPAETNNGEYVSGNFFQTLGVTAWRGRLLTDADDKEGAPPVAVMSFQTWQEKYGSDPSVVGAAYQINGHPFTVIGVAPPGFFGAKMDADNMPGIWLPLTTEPLIAGAATRLKDPHSAWLDLIGRVQPGTDTKSLEVQIQGELHQWLASHVADMSPQEKPFWEKQTLHLTPGSAGVSLMQNYKDGLRLLLVAAVCVLLVACANIANLLLVRGWKNRPQTAVRAALGASRAQLIRKALAESFTLSMFGAMAGIAVAYAGVRLMLHLTFGAGAGLPVTAAPSMPVLLFALAVSIATGIIFGMVPAWMTSHAEPVEALRGTSRIAGSNRQWAQKTLVIVQIAVSLVLLSAAAMLGKSLRNLEHQNFGFDPEDKYLLSIDPKISNLKQEALIPLFRSLEERLRTLPGVRAVGSALHAPMTGVWAHDLRIEGRPEPGPGEDLSSGWTRVTPGFFEAMGDRVVRGRPITDEDDASTRPVAVVNETFAKQFFGKENPIGKHFGPAPQRNADMYEIVGVVSDMEFDGEPQPVYFLPEAQSTHFGETANESREVWSHDLYNVVILAPGKHPEMQSQVKKALADVDPNLVMYDIQPYSVVVRSGFARQNMIASLTWLFGAVGLLLAAVGIYGVTAYGVEQRTSEIGVRMAMGANRGSVLWMVLRSAFWQAGIGVVLGVPAAIAAGWAIASQLYGVQPWSPVMLGFAIFLLGITVFAAAAIPARRAAAVDPICALRME